MTKYCSSNSSVIFPLWNKKYFNQKLPTQATNSWQSNNELVNLTILWSDVLVLGRLTCSTLLEPPDLREQQHFRKYLGQICRVFGPLISSNAKVIFTWETSFPPPNSLLKTMVEFRRKKLEQCSQSWWMDSFLGDEAWPIEMFFFPKHVCVCV